MTRINTNVSSLTAQHSLQKSQSSLQTALTRLSTGLRINTGKDDPAGLIASEQLGSEITSIGQSIKNSERAGNIIATADASLGEVSSLLNDVRNLVQSSANKGAISSDEIQANQVQVDNALDAITRIAQTTVFGGQKLLNGTKSFSVSGSLGAFNSPTDITINSFDPSLHTAAANDDVSLTVTTQATKKSVTLKGSDFNTATSNSLLDLSVGSSTRTSTTLVTNDNSLANATSSLNSLSTNSTSFTQVLTGTQAGASNDFGDLTGSGADTVTFSVTGEKGTVAGLTVNVAALQADSSALVTAINAVADQTGIFASGSGALGNVTLTSTVNGAKTIGASAITATAATQAGDDTTFNAAAGAIVDGTTGAGVAGRTTVFTVTGNKGSADISTAALSSGGFTGNDVIINNNAANDNGIQAFADLINTRTDSTGVVASVNATTHNLVLTSQGVGTSSLAGISVAAAGADQTLLASNATKTTTTGTNGTSNTSTFELIGDVGRAVITVNNDAVINDSTILRNAINAVTEQTGLTASGGGFGADVTLTASKYGSAGTVTVNALAASNSSDITLLNSANSRDVVAGADATGTISHSKGGGTFTATGEKFSYTDSAISLDGVVDPTLTPSVRASRTIQDTTAGAGGLDSLTGTGTDTISFQLTGVVGGNQVTTTISNVNVAALKGDSRVLADLINASSSSSGVRASTTGAGGNIVLQSTTAGASGVVGITATAATQAADVTAFNDSDTFTGITAGSNPSVGSNFDVTGGALFQIGPTVNFANQVNVNITSLDLATLGRNYSTTGDQGLASLKTGGTNSLDKSDLSDAATIVTQAIQQVATLRGKLGAIQKNAIDSNIRSLQTSLEQVTSAQSTIRDADFAVETAALTRSQILVQAGTNVLALANQSPQNVLALLKG